MATPDSLESNTYNTSDEQKMKEHKEAFHLPTHPNRCSCQGRRHEKATRAPSTGTSLLCREHESHEKQSVRPKIKDAIGAISREPRRILLCPKPEEKTPASM
jgi:hypothetical protein